MLILSLPGKGKPTKRTSSYPAAGGALLKPPARLQLVIIPAVLRKQPRWRARAGKRGELRRNSYNVLLSSKVQYIT